MEPEDEEITKPMQMAWCPATGAQDCPAGDMRCTGGSCRKLREREGDSGLNVGKAMCPSCGDWVPLDVHEFRCVGKGHHVAVSRDSVFPKRLSPVPTQGDYALAARNVAITVIALLIVIVLALVLSELIHRATHPTLPADRQAAS